MLKKVILRASTVTLCIIIISQFVSISARRAAGQDFTAFVFMMNTLLPLITAFPASFYIFWQNNRLKKALAELSELHKILQKKAVLDPLTELLNREAYLETVKLIRRDTKQSALLMLDVDHFKNINDQYGHFKGDTALKTIVGAIQAVLGPEDVFGRVGGEEFSIFLSNVSKTEAIKQAENIRSSVEAIQFYPLRGKQHLLSISIGLMVNDPAKTAVQMMRAADRYLYEAKAHGRNCVMMAGEAEIEDAYSAQA